MLVYIADENENTEPSGSIKENTEPSGSVKNPAKKENFIQKEKLKKYLRKVLPTRGGYIPTSYLIKIAKFLAQDTGLTTSIIVFLKSLRWRDLQVSVYDLYMQTPTLQGSVDNGCLEDSLFSYLFVALQDDKASLDSKEQAEKIYKELFDNDKLKQTAKNGKYIAVFLACAVFFLTHFKQSGLGTTYQAFFVALIEAIKTNKISKALARRLVSRLDRKKIPVPQELTKLLS